MALIKTHSQGLKKNPKPTRSFNHQEFFAPFSYPSLFLYFTIFLFSYLMKQQSLPTCMNHTGDGLPVLAAQIAHLLQFTDVLVEAVLTASCHCHLDRLLVCPALAGRRDNQPASSSPLPPPISTPNCCTLCKPAVIHGLGPETTRTLLEIKILKYFKVSLHDNL